MEKSSRMTTNDDRQAYVSVLSSDDYVDGILVLHRSLERTRPRFPFHVLLTRSVGPQAREALQVAGISTIDIDDVAVPEPIATRNRKVGKEHWNATFAKLQVFSLTRFRKLVCLDSDMLILRNIDELFEKPHMSAVIAGKMMPAQGHWSQLNSGLMVVVPEEGLTTRIMDLGATADQGVDMVSGGLGDQDLLKLYWSDWPERPELHLPERFNTFQIYVDKYNRKLKQPATGPDGFAVIHFVDVPKPWQYDAGSLARHSIHLLKQKKVLELFYLMQYRMLLRQCRKTPKAPARKAA